MSGTDVAVKDVVCGCNDPESLNKINQLNGMDEMLKNVGIRILLGRYSLQKNPNAAPTPEE